MNASQDEVIELVEIHSPPSSKGSAKNKFPRKQNKVGSPLPQSPLSTGSKTSDVSEIFMVKSQFKKPLPPVPRPRKKKQDDAKLDTPKSVSERASTSQDVSEISMSQRQPSEPTYSARIESKSDTKSYREKIKERFKAVKQQAGKSVSKVQDRRFQNGAEQILHLNRSIDMMKRENADIEVELRDYRHSRSQLDHEGGISRAQMYNFFCEENGVAEEVREETGSLQEYLTKSTEGLVIDKSDGNLLVCRLPELLELNLLVAESDSFWSPNREPVKLENKINDAEPRFLADEGLYKAKLPDIPLTHLNIIEQRLLAVDDTKWFTSEGDMIILENPFSKRSYRPRDSTTPIEFTEYVLPTQQGEEDYVCNSVAIIRENILKIYVSSLKFKHHPLFSSEHIFEHKLVSLYDTYRQKIATNKLERIQKRLEALRYVKKTMEQNMMAQGDGSDIPKKLIQYREEIKDLRILQFEESKEYRTIIHQVLETWKAVKRIREVNTYSNTSLKLVIRKEKRNYEEEKRAMDENVECTCQEIVKEMEDEYKESLSKYKQDMEMWRSNKLKHAEFEKEKPKKPTCEIDEEIIRQEVEGQFKECFKPPGEPVINFNLSYDNEITETVDNPKEKLRRNAVSTTKVQLKILCNRIEVCKSKYICLNNAFTCLFDESLSVKLSKVPENIVIEIHEQPSTLLKRKIGEIRLDIPSTTNTLRSRSLFEQHFYKEEIIHYKHDGVGSCIDVKSVINQYNLEYDWQDVLNTTGFLSYNIEWEDVSNADCVDKPETSLLNDVLKDDGTIDVNKLQEWTKNANIDPQNPKNSVLFEYISDYKNNLQVSDESSPKKYFRCNPYTHHVEFCSQNEIEKNIRFKFLELRHRNEPEFVGLVVPNRLKEIPTNILSAYKKRLTEEHKNFILEEDYDDDIDVKRSRGRKYLQQIHTKLFQLCRCVQNNLEYEDVVNEKMLDYFQNTIKTITSNIFNWFKYQPNASKPLPKLAKDVTKQDSEPIAHPVAHVIVNVISAINLPGRASKRTSAKSRASGDGLNLHDLTPFVRVRYENMTIRTNTAAGVSPKWNEEVCIPLETSNTDYLSPSALNGSVILDIFDEVSLNSSDNLNKHSEHWLGYVKIPISAVCQNGKIEGLFKVQTPQLVLGYEQELEKYQTNSPRYTAPQTLSANCSYLMLKVNFEPNIPKLHPNMDELPCSEPPYLREHILSWTERHNFNYSQRRFSALAIDINCKTACITRFIKPLEPPQLNADGFDVTPEQCARYVSLIPFTDCNKIYESIWLSTNQLLKIMIGSVVDHAVALTCFFLALNMETWLLLGQGTPNGYTAYVLVREYNRETSEPLHFIYDVTTAEKYNIVDTFSPLQKIFCLVSEHNVWANMQRTDEMINTRFDFSRRSDWLPLFDNQVTAPTNSYQQKLVHKFIEDVRELEFRLEKKLRKKIMKLRKLNRTIWNHDLTNSFKSAMPKFELSAAHAKYNFEILELRNFFVNHRMNGFVINIPYTNVKSLVEFIRSLNVHLVDDTNAEFVLTVYVYPYPNDVLVVWIVFASVIIKN